MLRISSVATSLALAALLAVPAAASAAPVRAGERGDVVVVVAGDVVVPRGETVEGVYILSGEARIAGRVDGDVVVLSGDVVLSGRVDGDLFTGGGTARLLPRAEVGGDVGYRDEHPVVSFDATVGGTVEKQDYPDLGGALPVLAGFLVWLALNVSAALLGILLILVAPRAADSIYARSRERAGPTIAIGIAIAIAMPVLVVLAAITVLGVPLAIGLALALLPLWAVAYTAAAWALGRRLLGPPRGRILSILAGIAILAVIGLVPILDAVVAIAAVVYGLGLIGAAIGAARDPQDPEPAQSPDS